MHTALPMQTATDIPTELFFDILSFLKDTGWVVTEEAGGGYKFVDVDFYTLERDGQRIMMHWDIWMEGEIRAAGDILDAIARHFSHTFTYGVPVHFGENR